MWPSMETHTRNLCNEFNPSKCTHTVVNTHTVNTHPEQWAANAAAPGEQLGVLCLPQGSHLSRGIEGQSSQAELYCHSAISGYIQWNEMSCLTGPRCYIHTGIAATMK